LHNSCGEPYTIQVRESLYGITDPQYNVKTKDEKCAICDKDFLVCGTKGNIRGRAPTMAEWTNSWSFVWLCNRGLGYFEDAAPKL
jgi:hypothetical protein